MSGVQKRSAHENVLLEVRAAVFAREKEVLKAGLSDVSAVGKADPSWPWTTELSVELCRALGASPAAASHHYFHSVLAALLRYIAHPANLKVFRRGMLRLAASTVAAVMWVDAFNKELGK